MRKNLMLSLLFLCVPLLLMAQNNHLSEMFNTPEKCHGQNGRVLELSKFFLENSLVQEDERVKDLMESIPQILVVWAIGSPDVIIELDGPVVMLAGNEKHLSYMIAYIAASVEYLMEHREKSLDEHGRVAVMERLLAFYENNKGVTGELAFLEKCLEKKLNGNIESAVKEIFAAGS